MPWKCPACSEQIQHAPGEDAPRLGVVYRCHICRLELALDRETGRLTAAPLPGNSDEGPPRRYRTS
jgi:DNA-directed RNA polymerase subunit RPC12/RpoP